MTMLSAVVWSVAILFVIISAQATSGILNNGVKWGFGSRDSSKDETVFQARAKRTVANHMESMMMFVPLALVAHLAGVSTDLAIKGAMLYVAARAIYPLTYWTGLPYARTVVWFVGVAGTAMVFFQVISAV
ncbi:MAG: hypothetical protein EX271_02930 [Acidimicrobiales bacterium]|nr:hypothetical protein [Hyphomonadaceae bacterium]RZV43890.1 MAG: hypothetical protein EX271_02930 [Acidimicrobiales bacterium]